MGLETGTYLNDLVATNPLATDQKQYGDDHLRLIKSVLKTTFPGMAGAFARVSAKATAYTVAVADNTVLFNCTASLTLALTAAATLGNSHFFAVLANGGDVTIDPNGAETINGAATLSVPNGTAALVWCTGSAFLAMVNSSIPNGTAGSPALYFSSDTNTGLFRAGTDTFGISGNGAEIARFGPSEVLLAAALNLASGVKSTTRTNLGLAIGTDVQGYDVNTAKTNAVQSWTDTQTFRDNKFEITDDSDTTKKLVFQCSSIGTGTTQAVDA
ncbi:hypothetical protein FJY94_06265, partial [Candidatus Kaiserbacteria bacterium]|nr:hypothetical protein [Candidatus Kaiserbacteria bacterium]